MKSTHWGSVENRLEILKIKTQVDSSLLIDKIYWKGTGWEWEGNKGKEGEKEGPRKRKTRSKREEKKEGKEGRKHREKKGVKKERRKDRGKPYHSSLVTIQLVWYTQQ